MVKVNGNLSPPSEMFNITRQGCPLSPLLYVLSLEPLLETLRNSMDVGGVRVGIEEHDILLYVTKPRLTLQNIMKELKKYEELTKYGTQYTSRENENIIHPQSHSQVLIFFIPGKGTLWGSQMGNAQLKMSQGKIRTCQQLTT